jgi:hypothetical protein
MKKSLKNKKETFQETLRKAEEVIKEERIEMIRDGVREGRIKSDISYIPRIENCRPRFKRYEAAFADSNWVEAHPDSPIIRLMDTRTREEKEALAKSRLMLWHNMCSAHGKKTAEDMRGRAEYRGISYYHSW